MEQQQKFYLKDLKHNPTCQQEKQSQSSMKIHAMTLLKPHSKEYSNMLFVIYEDAYGEINGNLKPINDVKALFNGTSEEFDVILSQL